MEDLQIAAPHLHSGRYARSKFTAEARYPSRIKENLYVTHSQTSPTEQLQHKKALSDILLLRRWYCRFIVKWGRLYSRRNPCIQR